MNTTWGWLERSRIKWFIILIIWKYTRFEIILIFLALSVLLSRWTAPAAFRYNNYEYGGKTIQKSVLIDLHFTKIIFTLWKGWHGATVRPYFARLITPSDDADLRMQRGEKNSTVHFSWFGQIRLNSRVRCCWLHWPRVIPSLYFLLD